MIDLTFDTVSAVEGFLVEPHKTWQTPASSPALAGTPQTRILEPVESAHTVRPSRRQRARAMRSGNPVRAEYCVVAGQAAFRYSWMRPSHRVDLTIRSTAGSGSASGVGRGGRCSRERWGRWVL